MENSVNLTANEKIEEIKNLLRNKNWYYVDIPLVSINKIYDLFNGKTEKFKTTELNDVESLYFGIYYGFKERYSKMCEYYKIAMEKGNSDAMISLGNFYKMFGTDHRENYENMRKYYLMAIQAGNPRAAYNLINYYYLGGRYSAAIETFLLAINTKAIDERTFYLISYIINSIDLKFEYYIELIEKLNYEDFSKAVGNKSVYLLLYKTYHEKIDLIDLHFKYAPNSDGFAEAKEDFNNKICGL